jgi:hypothetical protein
MQVIATRDDVHPSDDPQPFNFEIADDAAPEEVLRRAADRTWLPSIRGDRATWSIVSNEVLAVLAYQWSDLKLMPQLAERMRGGTGVRACYGSISIIIASSTPTSSTRSYGACSYEVRV